MRARPRTTYVAASPQTWELIRAAYLSGLSAPTAAARFGVSVTALRKRAAREGWTKQAFARAQGAPAQGAPAAPACAAALPLTPELSAEDAIKLRIEAIVARQMVPLHEEPDEMVRRALGMAGRAISEGRGLEAARLMRAARELRDLDEYLPRVYWEDVADEADPDGRREHMRAMIRTIALSLAEKLAAGEPLPEEFATARAERAEDFQ